MSEKKTMESKQDAAMACTRLHHVRRVSVFYSLFKALVNDEECFARLDLGIS